jgi:starch phosphorylase
MRFPRFAHSFEVQSDLPDVLQPLKELGYNFRWTWRFQTRDLFREIDENLWDELHHNPIELLQRVDKSRLDELAQDEGFLSRLRGEHQNLNDYLSRETWFETRYPELKDNFNVAYFCAEFGVSESLPIYSGGLGVLAGDHVKAASDLGIPLVGIGLLYSKGYFTQKLDDDGWQMESYPLLDFYHLALKLERGEDGQPLTVQVQMPDGEVQCQIWRADVGRSKIYLLDSNLRLNSEVDKSITDTLYGGDNVMRIRQEMILGLGGMRALRKLGIKTDVCHMNEGHAAFLSVERIRQYMEDEGVDLRTARQVTVNGNVFTTHTPVPAGFDKFDQSLLKEYLGPEIDRMKIPFEEFLKMGLPKGEPTDDKFNMALLAMENSSFVNGVSKLHAEISRSMFASRMPGWLESEVPIMPITNGVHTPTWLSRSWVQALNPICKCDWIEQCGNPEVWNHLEELDDETLWGIRNGERRHLIHLIRKIIGANSHPAAYGYLNRVELSEILDPDVLTIGFARRFATYKRGNLLFSDRERLRAMLYHDQRPMQIVLAGKAHPRDDGGKAIIQEIYRFIRDVAPTRVVFLEDYDMATARMMVHGVDLWLNTPLRPNEASGTSGMKAAANGVINCSVLDGWWDEGYTPEVGFAIGSRQVDPDQQKQSFLDYQSLMHVLEQEVLPAFYDRDGGGLPRRWIKMMRNSMRDLAPQFSSDRMVREYMEFEYAPANYRFKDLAQNGQSKARAALAWRDRINQAWQQVKINSVTDTQKSHQPMGAPITVDMLVELGSLRPDEVKVELVYGQIGAERELVDYRIVPAELVGEEGSVYRYQANFECVNPGHVGYTARVRPFHEDVLVPAEISQIRWEDH